MEAVLAAARRFRAAIEVAPVALVSFEKFPAGSCGDASELLGEYLADCGLGVWTYTMGVNLEAGRTHGWIEQDGLIADTTARPVHRIRSAATGDRDPGPYLARSVLRIPIWDTLSRARVLEWADA